MRILFRINLEVLFDTKGFCFLFVLLLLVGEPEIQKLEKGGRKVAEF